MKSFHEMLDLVSFSQSEKSGEEIQHYMFFSNLKAIKRAVDGMLAMDPRELDAMLSDGHDWAADHIATSKDDVEEVFNWISGHSGCAD